MKKTRVLFVLKLRGDYYGGTGPLSSGLMNSATYIVDMLNARGIDAKIAHVVDGNGIDREVFSYKPTHVVIEALWATPEKLAELKKLYPTTEWIVRVHSEIPFIAQEGMSVTWIEKYAASGVTVAFNSPNIFSAFTEVLDPVSVVYLPNYYPAFECPPIRKDLLEKGTVHVGCFGAVRLMKNQLEQAFAALLFSHQLKVRLKFHMTVSFHAGDGGQAALKNITALLGDSLVIHPWSDHDKFMQLLTGMDIVMQVSLTETFSVIAAEAVGLGIPIVTSPEVPWASPDVQAKPTSVTDILDKMELSWGKRKRVSQDNLKRLIRYSAMSEKLWITTLE